MAASLESPLNVVDNSLQLELEIQNYIHLYVNSHTNLLNIHCYHFTKITITNIHDACQTHLKGQLPLQHDLQCEFKEFYWALKIINNSKSFSETMYRYLTSTYSHKKQLSSMLNSAKCTTRVGVFICKQYKLLSTKMCALPYSAITTVFIPVDTLLTNVQGY